MHRSSDSEGRADKRLARLLRACQRGATAVEYGPIVSLIVIAMVTALNTVAEKTNNMWANVSNAVTRN